MAKRFNPWSVLVCHRTNESQEDQEALKEIVAEVSQNSIWIKKKTTHKSKSYYRHLYYRKRSKATKLQRELATKVNNDV